MTQGLAWAEWGSVSHSRSLALTLSLFPKGGFLGCVELGLSPVYPLIGVAMAKTGFCKCPLKVTNLEEWFTPRVCVCVCVCTFEADKGWSNLVLSIPPPPLILIVLHPGEAPITYPTMSSEATPIQGLRPLTPPLPPAGLPGSSPVSPVSPSTGLKFMCLVFYPFPLKHSSKVLHVDCVSLDYKC